MVSKKTESINRVLRSLLVVIKTKWATLNTIKQSVARTEDD